jgi:hypothetical protein
MSEAEKRVAEGTESRRSIVIGVAVVAAVVIAILFYVLMKATGGGTVEPKLQGAIRPGSPGFEENRQKIVLDTPEAGEARRALGDIVMDLHTTVRNFTGRTLNGLEITGSVVDHQGKPVKLRAVVVIPGKQPELSPNRTMDVVVVLDGMTDKDDRANIKMEVSGFKFKD